MERKIFDDLLKWKNNPLRKPLIVQGARQVGKTYIMKKFGAEQYQKFIYINLESSQTLKTLFEADFNVDRIITTIEIEINSKIDAKNTLIIFDEIQEANKGITALKYFYENRPDLHIIATGSLLGISIQKNNSYPVGKVDFLKMYPMTFQEFLSAKGEQLLLDELKKSNWNIINTFHEKIIDLLRSYYYVGGMPEAVQHYVSGGQLSEVRTIQENILAGYQNDFAKYAPVDTIPKIRLIWQNLISQLAKDNKKFIYSEVKNGSRAKDYENALNWLSEAGLILKTNLISKPNIPLSAYQNSNVFKLYFVDIGLFCAMGKVPVETLLVKNKILEEFKGALTEQYVCQHLAKKQELFYWTNQRGDAEVDFVIQKGLEIVPIEVKAEENLRSKSLKSFVDKFAPKTAIRFSMSKFREQLWLQNWPLYGVEVFLNE